MIEPILRDAFLKDNAKEKNKVFALYIDSPFCLSKCKFCKHSGAITQIGSPEYNKYFYKYLPGLLEFFKPVFEERIPDTVYFGGGTSSIMTENIMKNIFSAIPSFKDIKDKTFECSLNTLSDEKINLLSEYDFTRISFGVQSFDENVLKLNNRKNPPFEKIHEYISLLRKKNLIVNIDIMAFIGKDDNSEIQRVVKDIKLATNILLPSRITIYPETYKLIADESYGMSIAKKLRYELMKNIPQFNGYNIDFDFMLNAEKLKSNYLYSICLDDPSYDYGAKTYIADTHPNRPKDTQNLLGLGAYKDHGAYSYINDLYVNEVNEDWDTGYFIMSQ